MTNHKVAPRIKKGAEFIDQLTLSLTIEIDHHIATEDTVKAILKRKIMHQIQTRKFNIRYCSGKGRKDSIILRVGII